MLLRPALPDHDGTPAFRAGMQPRHTAELR
jgi:hypothetical protein